MFIAYTCERTYQKEHKLPPKSQKFVSKFPQKIFGHHHGVYYDALDGGAVSGVTGGGGAGWYLRDGNTGWYDMGCWCYVNTGILMEMVFEGHLLEQYSTLLH